MGCGGSKQEVATGNIRKKSETTQKPTAETDPVDNSKPPALTRSGTAKADDGQPLGQPVADVKDIIVNAGGVAAADEGKLRDSPDRYFSSRKDEEYVEAIAGGDYHTPRSEASGKEGEKKEAIKNVVEGTGETDAVMTLKGDAAEEKSEDHAVEEKKGLEGSGFVETAASDENGKLGSTNSGDLKETILVQETKPDVAGEEENNKQAAGEALGDPLAH